MMYQTIAMPERAGPVGADNVPSISRPNPNRQQRYRPTHHIETVNGDVNIFMKGSNGIVNNYNNDRRHQSNRNGIGLPSGRNRPNSTRNEATYPILAHSPIPSQFSMYGCNNRGYSNNSMTRCRIESKNPNDAFISTKLSNSSTSTIGASLPVNDELYSDEDEDIDVYSASNNN